MIRIHNKIERRDKLIPVIQELAAFAKYWVQGIHEVHNRHDIYPSTNWNSYDFLYVDPHNPDFYQNPSFGTGVDGTEAIQCRFNEFASIELYNFRPKAGTTANITVLPSELLERKVLCVEKKVYENNLSRPDLIDFEKTHRYEVIQAALSEFIVEIEAALKQTISYGGEIWGIGGETEIELRSKFGAKFENTTTTTSEKTETLRWKGEVPPRTVIVIDWTQSIGKYTQSIVFEGAIDYAIRILSMGDVDARWDSQKEFYDCLQGIGRERSHTPENPHATNWANLLTQFPLTKTQRYDGPGNVNGFVDPNWYKDLICPDIVGRVERDFAFNEASEVKRSINEYPLS